MTRSRTDLEAAQTAILALAHDTTNEAIRESLLRSHVIDCVENRQYDLALKAYKAAGDPGKRDDWYLNDTDLTAAADGFVTACTNLFAAAQRFRNNGAPDRFVQAFVEGVKNRAGTITERGLCLINT